ncbi:MAG: nickel-responsive transcriptional regulator NikR [Phycisphaerales bacterium]|nr:nickel-responsive transcriptional regulator NikR [Phycisphaerales bacterium]
MTSSQLVRLSISLEQPLFDQLEALVQRSKYGNRSEFVRDLIRERLVEVEWASATEVVGTITLVYDHDARQLTDRLIDIQHEHHEAILASTHVHLSAHLCAEMIMVRGKAEHIRLLADTLRRQRGVLHAALATSSTGAELH